jgi:hypothetical protein
MRRSATPEWPRSIIGKRPPRSASVARVSPRAVSHILKLPAEIRLTIYELVFDGKLLYDKTNYFDIDNSNIFAIFHTCTVMRNEATPIFYQTVHFELSWEHSYRIMKTLLVRTT